MNRAQVLDKLRALGVEPKKALGQNFLVSDHVVERILKFVELASFESIIEIGPGLGALTEGLMRMNKPLLLMELDRVFAQHWREREIKVIEHDALQVNWGELGLTAPILLVSNLPYQISSSLVIDRSCEPLGVETMILMFQKEVAKRLTAKARTEDYGLLTVVAQTFWQIQNVLEAGPSDFYPPPNVASRVLQFKLKSPPANLRSTESRMRFLELVKKCFAQRRKMLAKSWGHPQAVEFLTELGISPMARAEELDPEQFLSLYSRLVAGDEG